MSLTDHPDDPYNNSYDRYLARMENYGRILVNEHGHYAPGDGRCIACREGKPDHPEGMPEYAKGYEPK